MRRPNINAPVRGFVSSATLETSGPTRIKSSLLAWFERPRWLQHHVRCQKVEAVGLRLAKTSMKKMLHQASLPVQTTDEIAQRALWGSRFSMEERVVSH